ncbi:MAG TPA: hypothetical protein VF228_13700 [Iamia sp.]
MSDPRATHPLDVDLVAFVDGVLDAAAVEDVEAHLGRCLICRLKRQRIAQAPPIGVADRHGGEAPAFDPIEVEEADPSAVGTGELWLTAADDAAMVLVTEVWPEGRGVVVVPVVLDVEVADDGTLVLDGTASPLAVPMAIYDGMLTRLPMATLRGRIVPARPGVDLLRLSEDHPGVSRGSPLEGPADPRHEVRQAIDEHLVGAEPSSTTPQHVFDERFEELRRAFYGRDDAAVRPLHLPPGVPDTWEGIAQIESFNQRVLLLLIEGGLPEDPGQVSALCEQLDGSAVAVRADPRSPQVDVYLRANLAGARSVQTGAVLSGPILTGPDADTIVRYLDAMVSIPSVTALTGRRAPVDPKEILGRQVEAALAAQVATGRNARIPAKREGLTSVEGLGPDLTEALRTVFSKMVTPSAIIDLADGDEG